MSAAGEFRFQKNIHAFVSDFDARRPSAHYQNIGVVVLAAQTRAERVVHQCRANMRKTVGKI